TNAILTFRHAINFAGSAENRRACCRVYVSTSYAGDGVINENDWTQVEITYPSSDGWGFVSAGEIELPQSENLRVAFRYTCEDHDAPTWEVDEFMVK
ncbi:MAG TPA: choice-of-anchor J domain-containing protein, partial [Candidatus Avibacteroides avistercoris]|nr:choice-of-anchor J domain-containing protein [Candidatus Avibacteroides avistercoris]